MKKTESSCLDGCELMVQYGTHNVGNKKMTLYRFHLGVIWFSAIDIVEAKVIMRLRFRAVYR